ncbi:MAG: cytochrome [Deltaproteobacteria bacterium]|nr:cytochrome [Deltaproteobacteria bacterium]
MTSHRSPAGARALLASLAGILCLAALLSAVLSQAAGNDSPAPGLSQEETLRLGERIYRDGILSSGEPLTAVVQGDIPVEGTMFSCVSCHLRSGLGSFEGGVLTPPTNGNVLYKPWNSSRETAKLRKGSMEGSAKLWTRSWYYLSRFGEFPNRPAYTDETLSDAILEGVDPEGRRFLGVMPRYPLDKRDMAILIAYLKSLSAVPSPGVTETTIRFATVVTEEVSGAERDAMLGPLERYLRSFNARALREAGKRKGPAGEGGVSRIAADPDLRQMSLARWELKGSPETWRGQLEEYYRKEPVFALLGGITTKEWRPIHEFSEDHAVPCLFPVTDLPFVSNGWYTLYFSKGYYQEGETAARHLAREEDPDPGRTVVQVYPDTPEGNAFASGFRDAWSESGRGPLVDKAFPAGTKATREVLEQATGKERPAALVLWMGAEALMPLDAVAGKDGGISTIYLSATLLKEGLLTVPETLRDRTFITYPYGLPGSATGMMAPPPGGKKPPPEITDRKIAGKVASLSSVLTEVFMAWRSNFHRDYMFDIIDGSMLMVSSPYERISFGPGQRYASKGCYIVQLSKGATPELVKKSDWVVH